MRLPKPVSVPPLETLSSVNPDPDWMPTLQPVNVVVLAEVSADINWVFPSRTVERLCKDCVVSCKDWYLVSRAVTRSGTPLPPDCAPTGLRVERATDPMTRAIARPPSRR